MSRNPRPISHDVSYLTPSHPKSKVIFGVGDFQTTFFATGLIPGTDLALGIAKHAFWIGFCLIVAYSPTFPYVWPEIPQPRFPRDPPGPNFQKIHDFQNLVIFWLWYCTATSAPTYLQPFGPERGLRYLKILPKPYSR